jgi:hypothetical protein
MQQEKKLKVGVAVVLFDADHNILLGKRLNVLGEGTWGLPGGHQKIGESIEECASRELANKDYAVDKLKGILESLKDHAEVEQDVKRQGDQFIAILRPKR